MLENHKRSAIRMVVMSSSEDYNGKHTSVHNGHCSFLCYVSCGIGFLLPFVHVNSFGHIETLPPFYRTQVARDSFVLVPENFKDILA